VRTWRATGNGLEGIAAVHSDVLLALDEIGEANPEEVGSVVYLLANETGKARSARSGLARPAHRWRVLYLSSGETPLVEVVQQGRQRRQGRSIKAGQELRLADVAVPPEGLFVALHGSATPAEFARRLADGFAAHHGHVGVAWIAHLSAKRTRRRTLPGRSRHGNGSTARPTQTRTPKPCEWRVGSRWQQSQAKRPRRGLTGWKVGAASEAALVAFTRWHEAFGDGASELKGAIQRLHGLVTREGRRFELIGPSGRTPVVTDRAGFYVDAPGAAFFYEDDSDGLDDPQPRYWLVLPDVFARDACDGSNQRAIESELCARGILIGQAGKSTQKRRIPNLGSATYRVYVVDGQALADAADGTNGQPIRWSGLRLCSHHERWVGHVGQGGQPVSRRVCRVPRSSHQEPDVGQSGA